jgi:hypothetical protein
MMWTRMMILWTMHPLTIQQMKRSRRVTVKN